MQTIEVLRRSPTADYLAVVLESVFLTPTIKRVRLKLDRDEFRFLPGQSVWPRFEREGRSFSKIYSIASSPACCPEIELCVSRVGWSSAYLQDLLPGATLPLRGPYGLMTLSQLPQRPRLYLAEGSGIAPLKSQLDWLYESHYAHPVWLIQANPETADQLPYRTYWEELAQRWPGFHYQPVTIPSPESVLAALGLDLSKVDIEICAVGERTEALQTIALALGAQPNHLRAEKFFAF